MESEIGQPYLPYKSSQIVIFGLCHGVCKLRFQVVTLIPVLIAINADFGSTINLTHLVHNA